MVCPRQVFFVLAYIQQQGIPRDTLGVPSHYYTPKSGRFLQRSAPASNISLGCAKIQLVIYCKSADMQVKASQSNAKRERRHFGPLHNKLHLRVSALPLRESVSVEAQSINLRPQVRMSVECISSTLREPLCPHNSQRQCEHLPPLCSTLQAVHTDRQKNQWE